MLSILKNVSIVCKMLYTRNCSVLKRRRNGKILLALLVFVYITYLVVFANIEPRRLDDKSSKHESNPKKDDYQIDQSNHFLPRSADPKQQMWANYHKIKDNGAMGKEFVVRKETLNEAEKKKFDEGWLKNAYNEYASNLIPLNRTLEDIRQEGCKTDPISTDLPTSSVIMCFHNEALSVLLRGVHSIVDRSPPHLLKEVLLVDDFSDMPHLFDPLTSYLEAQFGNRVRVLRNQKREGLIRSRLHGAREASGEVLVFLDSHIECTPGWLEPLLQLIKQDSSVVVTPLIDIIDKDNLAYKYNKGPRVSVGGFNWDMVFTWHVLPEAEHAARASDHAPARSPTMAGGLFAISKEYFGHIGTYDAGMEIWGGENLEISFRIWMCGGSLLTVPCSRVGHIFRDRSPYKWKPGVNVVQKNSIRCAQVWMDEYKQIYFSRKSISEQVIAREDVAARQQLRRDLNCRSFQWYLDNIYPTMWNPYNSLYKGALTIEHMGRTFALFGETNRKKIANGKAVQVQETTGLVRHNLVWYFSRQNEIRVDDACLDFPPGPNLINKNKPNKVLTFSCHGAKGNQEFIYKDQQIYHPTSKLCMKIVPVADSLKFDVVMTDCDRSEDSQAWLWDKYERPANILNQF